MSNLKQSESGSLTIQSASQQAGVSAHTIRAWEKRFRAVVPARSPSGRRYYSWADVTRLKLLGQLTRVGHSIGGIVRLSQDELELLGESLVSPVTDARPRECDEVNVTDSEKCSIRHSILSALARFDLESIDRELIRARLQFSVSEVALEIISPLLTRVGQLVGEGSLGIGEEHSLSAVVRDHLGQMMHVARPPRVTKGPKFLLATQEGDFHEFGILLAAVLCLSHGYAVHFLGANVPAREVARVAQSVGAEIVLLGSVPLPQQATSMVLRKYVGLLSRSLAPEAEIWIGGYCSFRVKDLRGNRVVKHLDTLQSLQVLLINR